MRTILKMWWSFITGIPCDAVGGLWNESDIFNLLLIFYFVLSIAWAVQAVIFSLLYTWNAFQVFWSESEEGSWLLPRGAFSTNILIVAKYHQRPTYSSTTPYTFQLSKVITILSYFPILVYPQFNQSQSRKPLRFW